MTGLRGFFYANGKSITLGTLSREPGGNRSAAQSINSLGQVVGWSTASVRPHRDLPDHAFLPVYAFLWQRGGRPSRLRDLGTLPGWANSYAYGVNGRGEVIGSVGNTPGPPDDIDPDSRFQAFLWRQGKMTGLGALPGSVSSEAYGINNAGQVVGRSGGRAFLWQNSTMLDLNALLPAGFGWVLAEARAINNKGQIAGNGKFHGTSHAFLLTPQGGST